MMQDISKLVGSNFHADKPAQQSNDQQQQGRQQDRRPSQSQSRSQSQQYRDQKSSSQGRSQSTSSQGQGPYPRKENDYHSQNKPYNNRAYPHRSQSQDNRPPPQQAERKIVWREPKLYVSGNRHYYDCATCTTTHTNIGDESKCIKIKALQDSGCAKTVIKNSVFEQLEIMKPERQIVLISCTGKAQPIQGSADIILHFEGTNSINTAYQLNVLVHTALSQDFLLGRDFTGSDAKASETNKHLYLTDNFDLFWDPIRTSEQNKTLCQIPLLST
jgi:hypothetical protein